MKRLDNKGVSLIELILAIAISFIVIAAIISFMSVGTKSYNYAEDEINIQTEGQILMNQISDMIITSNNVKVTGNTVNIYYIDSSYSKKRKEIIYDNATMKIYLRIINTLSEETTATGELLANHVKSFAITDTGADINKLIKIQLTLENNKKNYTLSSQSNIRNKLVEVLP